MIPHTVSVFLDYKCNLECSHCSLGSSPKLSSEIDWRYVEQALREGCRDIDSQVAVFTGGEVTLHMEKLLRGLRLADDLGYSTRIVTNAGWAGSMEQATEVINRLEDAGLDEINMSFDDFHAEWISEEHLLNFTEAALNASFKNIVISMVNPASPTYDVETVRGLIEERVGAVDQYKQRLTLMYDTPAAVGRATGLADEELVTGDTGRCESIMESISVHPDGYVRACCGHAQWYVPDLTIGSLDQQPLDEMVERSGRNLLYWLIQSVGPEELLKQIGVENEYTGICHACHHLLSEHRSELLEYVRQNFDEIRMNDVFLDDLPVEAAAQTAEHEKELIAAVRENMKGKSG